MPSKKLAATRSNRDSLQYLWGNNSTIEGEFKDMGGSDGVRGYVVQAMIAIVDSLQALDWDHLSIEPNEESEKIDLKWTWSTGKVRLAQVKSSKNSITLPMVREWASEIRQANPTGACELILIGPASSSVVGINDQSGVCIPTPKNLDLGGFLAQAAHHLDSFCAKHGLGTRSALERELLVAAITGHMMEIGVHGNGISRESLVKKLSEWISLFIATDTLKISDARVVNAAVTGRRAALEQYVHGELCQVLQRTKSFRPIWFEQEIKVINRTAPNKLTSDHLALLDRLNIQQSAKLAEYPKPQHTGKNHESNPPFPLDELLESFGQRRLGLQRRGRPFVMNDHYPPFGDWEPIDCLILRAAPGAGKTWNGLRLLLRLLRQLLEWQTALTDDPNAVFPVWITAYQLGELLDKSEGNLVEALKSRPALKTLGEQFESMLLSRNVLLIVDAWDERRTGSDQRLRDALQSWVIDGHRLVVTSRALGQGDLADTVVNLRVGVATFDVDAGEDYDLCSFVKQWFENPDSLSTAEQPVEIQPFMTLVRGNRALADLLRTPQFAAISCWLFERGESIPDRPDLMFQAAIVKMLDHFRKTQLAKADSDAGKWLRDEMTRVTTGGLPPLLELLQLLAYHTFNAQRWSFTEQEVAECFNEIQSIVKAWPILKEEGAKFRSETARLLLDCGLFTAGSDGRAEITHQALAETLVAGELTKVPAEERSIWLEERANSSWKIWRNVFYLVFEHLPDEFAEMITGWEVKDNEEKADIHFSILIDYIVEFDRDELLPLAYKYQDDWGLDRSASYAGVGICEECGCYVVGPDLWKGGNCSQAYPTYHGEYLCEECNEGEPGHSEYHTAIDQTERDRHHEFVPNLPRRERRQAHEAFERIAEDEHLACPWAERGEECDIVEEIKRQREERELT